MNLLVRINELALTQKIENVLNKYLKEKYTANDIVYIRKILREENHVNFFQIFKSKTSDSTKCIAKVNSKMLIFNYKFASKNLRLIEVKNNACLNS